MIGQKELLDKINLQIEKKSLSRFVIFVGAEGSGKRTLMREVGAKNWKLVDELPDVKIDTIRKMIEDAYKVASPTLYIIPNANKMSVQAKNAILKVVEEPPQKSTFFMSTTSVEELLPTITSRGSIFYMRPYTITERAEYLKHSGKRLDEQDFNIILRVSNNISDIDKLLKTSPGEFRKYAVDLISNIDSKSAPVVFSYNRMIDFKSEEDTKKYDLTLLWKMCCLEWRDMIDSDEKNGKLYADLISETSKRVSDIRVSSISKSNTFDMWLLNCRKIIKKWRDNN